MKKLRIGLDLDDTVNYWWNPYIEKFGNPKSDTEITKNVQNILINDKEFWLNLPIKNRPNFEPELICTKRVSSKRWTKKWLRDNLGINPPVYQMYYQKGNKAHMIKGRVDVFIDDSIDNFIQMNLSGVPCLLMDSPGNQSWGPIARIYTLNREEIEDIYSLFIKTIYPHFKEYVKTYRSN